MHYDNNHNNNILINHPTTDVANHRPTRTRYGRSHSCSRDGRRTTTRNGDHRDGHRPGRGHCTLRHGRARAWSGRSGPAHPPQATGRGRGRRGGNNRDRSARTRRGGRAEGGSSESSDTLNTGAHRGHHQRADAHRRAADSRHHQQRPRTATGRRRHPGGSRGRDIIATR